MLKTRSTQGMLEHNLHPGWIQVKYQCGMYFWTKNNMLKTTQGMHEHNLHTDWIQVKHTWYLFLKQNNMLKTHSTQSMHEHNLQTG